MRDLLAEWRLPRIENDCLLVTSELVTNAVRYGGLPIQLTATLAPSFLTVEVADANHRLAAEATPSDMAEKGRGLDIVRACTDHFTFVAHPDDGKSAVATWGRGASPHAGVPGPERDASRDDQAVWRLTDRG